MLNETEPKVIKVCLEEQGFTVHDEWALHQTYAIGVDQGGLQSDYYGYEEWHPDPALAADWGFGQWMWTAEDFEAVEEYNRLRFPDEPEAVEEESPDNSAFEALAVEDRIAWYEAYMGPEKMEHDDIAWRLRNPDANESEIAEHQAEVQEGEDDGTIETETVIDAPEPGGCELQMIESLYGEPQKVEEEMEDGVEEGLTIYTWKYRPEAPAVPATDAAAVEADTAAVSEAFLSCVADRGYGEWEFQEGGWLPIYQYFELVYQGGVSVMEDAPGAEEVSESLPEPPADLPADFEGRKAYESEMAVAFSECADEVEYRETVMTVIDAAELETYRAIETELFAYQDALRASLTAAQDLLEACALQGPSGTLVSGAGVLLVLGCGAFGFGIGLARVGILLRGWAGRVGSYIGETDAMLLASAMSLEALGATMMVTVQTLKFTKQAAEGIGYKVLPTPFVILGPSQWSQVSSAGPGAPAVLAAA